MRRVWGGPVAFVCPWVETVKYYPHSTGPVCADPFLVDLPFGTAPFLSAGFWFQGRANCSASGVGFGKWLMCLCGLSGKFLDEDL